MRRALRLLTVLAAASLLAAAIGCARPDAPAPASQPSPTATHTVSTLSSTPTAPSEEPGVHAVAELVAEELKAPWSLDFAPDDRIFITEKEGNIRVIVDGELQDCAIPGHRGSNPGRRRRDCWDWPSLPTSAANGYFYVYHTYKQASGALANRVVRWQDTGQTADEPRHNSR